jgi:hypothetical protein
VTFCSEFSDNLQHLEHRIYSFQNIVSHFQTREDDTLFGPLRPVNPFAQSIIFTTLLHNHLEPELID